ILLLRSGPYFPLRRHQNCQPIKREDNESERVPTGNCCGRESNMSTRGKEYHCSSNQSQGETMSRVLAVDKIDNAHLCSRVTIFGSSGKLPLQPLLPFGRLWYGEPNAISNAIDYAKHRSRSHDAVIRVYDEAGNVIESVGKTAADTLP